MWRVPRGPVVVAIAMVFPLGASPAQRTPDAVAAIRVSRPDSTEWRAEGRENAPQPERVAMRAVAAAYPTAPTVVWRRPPMSAWGYAGIGALIGSAATITGLVLYFEENGDAVCMCGPVTFLPIVSGGAAVGALVGSIMYAVRGRD
jgi:hypothetical protein